MAYGDQQAPILICPQRLLEGRQIFADCMHLLTLHEPGNELHVIPEISLPGGSVDFFLVSAKGDKPVDFVGIELQTLDTTGTIWPERQRFLDTVGVPARKSDLRSLRPFGMNWKMTAKTTLVQLHHKVETFEHLSKRLVLVVQDRLLEYVCGEFSFQHVSTARLGDTMHFHAYGVKTRAGGAYGLQLVERLSTDAAGVSTALGLRAQAKVELNSVFAQLTAKMSATTRWSPA